MSRADQAVDAFHAYRSNVPAVLTFMPIGNAPRLKNPKYEANGSALFAEVFTFLRAACSQSDVHLYVNNQFEPLEDQTIADVVRCCGKPAQTAASSATAFALNIHYSVGRAYV